MTNYRTFYNKQFLAGEDLNEGEQLDVTIATAWKEEVQSTQGLDEKLVLSFEEIDKKYIPGIKMAKVIGSIAGSKDVENWIGVKISLHTVMEKNFGEVIPVIRIVRPLDQDLIAKIKGAKSRDELKSIYDSMTMDQKTDKKVNEIMLNTKKSLK